jgi:hypothetical protein
MKKSKKIFLFLFIFIFGFNFLLAEDVATVGLGRISISGDGNGDE